VCVFHSTTDNLNTYSCFNGIKEFFAPSNKQKYMNVLFKCSIVLYIGAAIHQQCYEDKIFRSIKKMGGGVSSKIKSCVMNPDVIDICVVLYEG
jgi:hypothetical protein